MFIGEHIQVGNVIIVTYNRRLIHVDAPPAFIMSVCIHLLSESQLTSKQVGALTKVYAPLNHLIHWITLNNMHEYTHGLHRAGDSSHRHGKYGMYNVIIIDAIYYTCNA